MWVVCQGSHVLRPRTVLARRRIIRLDVRADHPEPYKIRQAVALLDAGRVVVYPTDTIYGLGAAVDERTAVDGLYQLRRLDPKKPLALVCANLSQASRYTIIDNECYRFMRRALPGPFTFILKASSDAPRWLGRSRRRTVGVRVPDSPVAQALVDQLGRPLISTSAIVDGIPERPSDPAALADRLDPQIVGIVLDAGLLDGVPSTVIDWSGDEPELVRQGAGDVSELGLS